MSLELNKKFRIRNLLEKEEYVDSITFQKIKASVYTHVRKNIFVQRLISTQASLVVQLVKNPPAMQETPVQFLGQEDPLEKG